jgi:Flp pilus assembly protein TadG
MSWLKIFRSLGGCGAGDGGTASVELALLAPALAYFMAAGWDFGNALYQQERLVSAARAGAQYGIQSTADSTNYTGMILAARNDANDAGKILKITAQQACTCPGGGSIACTATCTGNTAPRVYDQVVASESYATLGKYPFVANPIPLTSTVMLRFQ